MAFGVGERLGGRYEIYRVAGGAGRSGMGTVYICYDHEQGGALALKTYQEGFFHDKALVDHFKRGALAWIQLDHHPYVVQAYGVFPLADRLFLGLEYIAPDDENRNTLSQHLQGAVAPALAIRWGMEFCDAMEHARARGITPHRDIKPDNLMVTREGSLKVTDFDLAGLWKDAAPPEDFPVSQGASLPGLTFIDIGGGKHVMGTPPWMAPEQFDGLTTVQSDIYSFGAVLYQMAAGGRLPCRPANGGDWRTAHERVEPERLPTPLWPIIERCLAKRPAERFGGEDAEAGFIELRAALEDLWRREVPARAVPTAPRGRALEAIDHTSKATSLAALGLYDRALVEYKKALALEPDYAPAYLNLGVTFAKRGDKAKAVKAYRKAIHLDPTLGEAYNNYGLLCKEAGELGQAEKAYRKAIALNPSMSGAFRNLAVLLSEAGRHEEAIELLAKAIAHDPTNADFHYSHGVALEKAGRYREAIDKYTEAVRLRPRHALYHYGLGNGWRLLGDMGKAVACWEQAVGLDPALTLGYFNLGIAYERAGDARTAYRYHRRAIESDPSAPGSYYNVALLLAKQGLYGEGADAFEEFLDHITPELEPHAAKARELMEKMRGDEAIAQENLQYPEAVYNRGNAYLNLDRLEEAKAWFERALSMRPEYPSALTALGIYHERRGDWDQAAVCHRRALESDPDFAIAWNNLGWVGYKTGNRVEAIEAYSRYILIAPPEHGKIIEDAKAILAELQQAGPAERSAPAPAVERGTGASTAVQIDEILSMFVEGKPDEGLAGLANMADSAGSPDAHNTLGEEHASRGRYEEALDQYFKALELDPENLTALFNIGRAFIGQGEYRSAQGHFRDLMAQYPGQASFPYNLGEALRLAGSMEEAVVAYQKALAIDPKLSPAHCNLGVALEVLGRVKPAISAYHAAIKSNNDNDTAHFNLAQALDRQGFGEQAIASFREFVRCARPGREQHAKHAEQAIVRLGG